MQISELLFQAAEDKNQNISKQEIRKAIKEKGQKYLMLKKLYEQDSVTRIFLNDIQEAIEKQLESVSDVKCSKGCSACCHSKVTLGEDEAHLLVSYTKERKLDFDLERMEIQSGMGKWSDLSYRNQQCIFLNADHTCSVYDVRPGVCRKHLVTSDPEKCNVSSGKSEVKRVFNLEAEILVSTLWQFNKIGTLADMVRAELKNAQDEEK